MSGMDLEAIEQSIISAEMYGGGLFSVASIARELLAEVGSLRAKVAAVEALCDKWDIPEPDAGVAYARDEVRRALTEATP